MKHRRLTAQEQYARKRKRRMQWRRITVCLAAIVVFCTTYALILPAITMEKGCEIPEHVHTEECYTKITEITSTVPVCNEETLKFHRHEEGCYNEERELICGYADFLVHTHDANCFDEAGNLWCSLPEVKEHTHDESCYLTTSPHVHDDGCYALERGELICGEHEHTEDCRTEVTNLVCSEEHEHTEDCYEIVSELTCGFPEDHQHGDDCYDWTKTLICQQSTEGERILVCEKDEIRLHEHTNACYDSQGVLICEKTEILEHQHGEECFGEITEPVDTENLTCQNSQEGHEHSALCYGSWQLQCEIMEHTHNEECSPKLEDEPEQEPEPEPEPGSLAEPESLQEPEEPVYNCEQEEHTHGEGCYDQEGTLICSLAEHTHGEACLTASEEVIYYCEKEEHTHGEGCYDEEGTLICSLAEHTHSEECLVAPLTDEEIKANEEKFAEQVEELESQGSLTEENRLLIQELLAALEEACEKGEISQQVYEDLTRRLEALLMGAYDGIAEACYGTNWIRLRDSGWFNQYGYAALSTMSLFSDEAWYIDLQNDENAPPSAVQIDKNGGQNSSDDVTVSKTIAGTDLENVFDITLTVKTPQRIDEVISEPDMAVVIVMDISNTMNDDFGGVTRYAAAMAAAEDFLDNFAANNTLGVSKVGYVAFNTDAHQIFGLQSCTNETQANALKNTMRTATGSIINADGYKVAHNRFTNIEGGLKMAQDMLSGVSNKNKFIILLTDGFPTTYLESGYKGYDPYDTTGRFYDHVLNVPCASGTSYSDEAAIRARNMAASIKNSDITIFSIGVDVGGQTIQAYIESSEKLARGDAKISIVDRKGTTYEIGSETSTEAYKNWLRNSIGSGYYYDSTNTAGLKDAYTQIFEQIKTTVESAAEADWVASDPIPVNTQHVEFIGLYDKSNTLQKESLTGEHIENGENTAQYGEKDSTTINWDLKKSGYTTALDGSTTTYSYKLMYRVRLKNEESGFVENQIYNTNDKTTLQYRLVQTVNGSTSVSDSKTIDFPIPSVYGYLAELTFDKKDNRGSPLSGAEFTLAHDVKQCNRCRGDGNPVTVDDMVVTSDGNGTVCFENIPSGHTYTLTETGIPDGYSADGTTYQVKVDYDILTVIAMDSGENEVTWNGIIINNTSYRLPDTGGIGTGWYIGAGLVLILGALALLYVEHRRRGDLPSS